MNEPFLDSMSYPLSLRDKTINPEPPVNIGKTWAEIQKLNLEKTPLDSLTQDINEALRKYSADFDNYFRVILQKNGITEQEWRKNGKLFCKNGINQCIYKNNYIFWYTDPKIPEPKLNYDEQMTQTMTSYCGEPSDEDKMFWRYMYANRD